MQTENGFRTLSAAGGKPTWCSGINYIELGAGIEPELSFIPAILEFLGYIPYECPKGPIGQLQHFKKVKGLSYERLGKTKGRDPEQLTDWLSGGRSLVKKI